MWHRDMGKGGAMGRGRGTKDLRSKSFEETCLTYATVTQDYGFCFD